MRTSTCWRSTTRKNPAALKTLVGSGAKPFRMPKDVMDAAFKAAFEVYAELNKTNPAWKKVYTDYNQFLREENLWFRFTESAFDNFMQVAADSVSEARRRFTAGGSKRKARGRRTAGLFLRTATVTSSRRDPFPASSPPSGRPGRVRPSARSARRCRHPA